MKLAVVVVSLVLLSSPVFAITTAPKMRSTCDFPVELYATDIAPKPYVVLKQMVVKGRSELYAGCKMKGEANEVGADAVLNYKVASGIHDDVFGGDMFMAEGVAVKWATDGERGFTTLRDAPMPVELKRR